MKETVDRLDFIKIKSVCSTKGSVKRMKRLATDWENMFAKNTSDKGLILKIQKTVKTQQ